MKRRNGFTLIELLIVVAIIAILAAIAVPNFLEAQVRAKVSHTKNDFRALRTGLEAYRVDNNEYPMDTADEDYSFHFLTTPIAYLSSIPRPSFVEKQRKIRWYLYWGSGGTDEVGTTIRKNYYVLTDVGPNQTYDLWAGWVLILTNNPTFAPAAKAGDYVETPFFWQCVYDPTNGSVSFGDIVATQKGQY